MPYLPPSGWLERLDDPSDASTDVSSKFHRRKDCSRITRPEVLVAVDRPYHAPRCRNCAQD